MGAGRKRIVIDAEKLMLLRDGGLSNEEIAAAFKCSVPTVANRTRELQLQGLIEYKRRRVKSVKHIRKEELSEASEHRTLRQLAELFGVSVSTITKRLTEYNIPKRKGSAVDRIVTDVRVLSTHRTREEIADLLGISRDLVDKCCRKYKIKCKDTHHMTTTSKHARRDAILALSGQSNWTHSEIALAFDISRERVRQIVTRTSYLNAYSDDGENTQ
jgi:DNA-binding CsgD family transcriptional regulator